MKKSLIILAVAFGIVACNEKPASISKEFKTAYIDTSKLMEESLEAKDIEQKFKAKSEKMGGELQAEVNRFKAEAANFQKNAMANGQAWAEKKGAELQQQEQKLTYAQQAMLQQLQQESGVEMDTLVKTYRKIIKDYGKEKGYDYIYGTGETASVLYAKEGYDVTKEIIKMINDKYKSSDKKEK